MTSFMNRNSSQAKKYDELTSQFRDKRKLSYRVSSLGKTGGLSSRVSSSNRKDNGGAFSKT